MSRLLRQFAIWMALFAVLLPSVAQLLPTAHGQPFGLGELCTTAGHRQAPDSDNPSAPDQTHGGHCLLCFMHAADIGLPPTAGLWNTLDGVIVRVLAQPASALPTMAVWLLPHPRGPPTFS